MTIEKVTINGHQTKVHFIEGQANQEESIQLRQKLISREELSSVGDFLRRRGMRIAFTTGVYDVIHNGHARYLNLARTLGDVLVVGLNNDESVRALKGPSRPIVPEILRAEMLSFLDFVDYITLFPESTGAATIGILKPDSYLCVEGSWQGSIDSKEEVIATVEAGGVVFCTPRQNPSISTTNIIASIEEKYGEKMMGEMGGFFRQKNNE